VYVFATSRLLLEKTGINLGRIYLESFDKPGEPLPFPEHIQVRQGTNCLPVTQDMVLIRHLEECMVYVHGMAVMRLFPEYVHAYELFFASNSLP
jgi:hypothetical protein